MYIHHVVIIRLVFFIRIEVLQYLVLFFLLLARLVINSNDLYKYS